MGKKIDFEYIVIGSGPAGSAVALTLAKAHKKVGLIEAGEFGGSNLNSRNVPYIVSHNLSRTYYNAQNGAKFGLTNLESHFNFPSTSSWREKVVARVSGDRKKEFEDAGITCINGYANLLDNTTVAVGDKQYRAARIVLATGSKVDDAGISGTETVAVLTPESALKIRRFPKAVAVVGGGASGCEIAEYFGELGTKVLLFEMADRVLPHEDQDVGSTMAEYFKNELGIMVLTDSRVVAVEQDNLSKRVIFMNNGRERMVRVDTIVLATGSKPALDYGLENAGVKYKNSGVLVNKAFQTSAKNIFAVGDILGGESSTERADYQGLFLASNLIGRNKNLPSYAGFPRITKTYPEVAVVGMTEDDMAKRDKKCRKAVVKLADVITGKVEDDNYSFVKLIADNNDKIIGAAIVAPNAEAMISELTLAVRYHLSALEIASAPHTIESASIAIKLAAKQLVRKKK